MGRSRPERRGKIWRVSMRMKGLQNAHCTNDEEEYGQDIHNVRTTADPDNFPYEYYSVRFRHLLQSVISPAGHICAICCCEGARIDNETHFAHGIIYAHSFTASMCRWPIVTGENSYRQQKVMSSAPGICRAINDTLETYQFGVRSGAKSSGS